MVALAVKKFSQKILVVGAIYNNIGLLEKNKILLDQHDLIILNGNGCYPNDNLEAGLETIEKLLQTGKVIYNLGNQDLLLMKELEWSNSNSKILKWMKNKGNVVLVDFISQFSLIITNGGITPSMKKTDLHDNLETSFVNEVNNQPWHHWYGGGYGYVISNNPLTQAPPKFYNFSMQMGNQPTSTEVYAVQVDQYGVGRTFLL